MLANKIKLSGVGDRDSDRPAHSRSRFDLDCPSWAHRAAHPDGVGLSVADRAGRLAGFARTARFDHSAGFSCLSRP
jgi:hypothetical protein